MTTAFTFAAALAAVANAVAAYTNPVIDAKFPDPSLLNDDGVYYAYATNSNPEGVHLPVRRSTDLIHWKTLPDAMPALPDWVKPGRNWAPYVATIESGKSYVCYFTAWDRKSNKQVVGVATASSPAGPFLGTDEPLVVQASIGGAIDASCFVAANGERYLLWKNDGNSIAVDTWLWIQPLSEDGVSLTGSPIKLIKQSQPWEGTTIEGPTLWEHGGKFYLFYSANFFKSCDYAIGYAVSTSLYGPYVKPGASAWMASTQDTCGPGGEDIVKASDGTTWMAYHTWKNEPGSYRPMSIKRLEWDGDVPVLR